MKKNVLSHPFILLSLATSLIATPLVHGQWSQWSDWQPMPNPIIPGNIQPGQWSDWQPVPTPGIPGQVQTRQWEPWQSGLVPGQLPPGQWQTGQWQTVNPAAGAPGTQAPPAGPRTIYRTQEKSVTVFNSLTGQYETKIVQEIVPVQIGAGVPGGAIGPQPQNPVGNRFAVTVVNRLNTAITFNIGNQNQTIGAGQSWQFMAAEGQEYGYSGSPREVAPGQWVGGGTYRGQISSNQRTITVGDQPAPAPNPNPTNFFTVNFVNRYNAAVGIEIYDQNRNPITTLRIQAGESVAANVRDGYTYVQTGPVVYVNGGAISGTRQGQISASNPQILLQD